MIKYHTYKITITFINYPKNAKNAHKFENNNSELSYLQNQLRRTKQDGTNY